MEPTLKCNEPMSYIFFAATPFHLICINEIHKRDPSKKFELILTLYKQNNFANKQIYKTLEILGFEKYTVWYLSINPILNYFKNLLFTYKLFNRSHSKNLTITMIDFRNSFMHSLRRFFKGAKFILIDDGFQTYFSYKKYINNGYYLTRDRYLNLNGIILRWVYFGRQYKYLLRKKIDIFSIYVNDFSLIDKDYLHNDLRHLKKLISANEIGQIFSFDAYEGWHLSNWRPWQNYEDSYTVKKNMGGGIILDGSHELNYLQWLGGKIELVYCMYSKIPNISKNVEGIAEILMKFNSKAIGRIHLDFLNPKYNRHCEILGDKGSIIWSFENKTIEIQKNLNKKIKKIKYGNDTNQMYIDEIKHVIKCIKGNKDEIISLKESINTLKTSLIIKKSGEKGKSIKI